MAKGKKHYIIFFLSLCRFKGLRTVTAQIISIGLQTWVSPIYQAPYAVMKLRFFQNHKHTQQLLPINNNHLEQSNIREEREVVVGGLVAEHWRLKPEALGSIPNGTTSLSFPLPFQRSSNSNGPDNLYRSSDLGEPHLSGSLCCDEAQILSKNNFSFLSFRKRIMTLQPVMSEIAKVATSLSFKADLGRHHPHAGATGVTGS